MNKFLNFISILGLLGLCIKMWLNNQLSVGIIAVILVGALFVLAQDGAWSKVLKLAVGVLSIGYLLVGYIYSNQQFVALMGSIGALLLMLFGFFIMFGGLRKNNNEINISINSKTGKIKRK